MANYFTLCWRSLNLYLRANTLLTFKCFGTLQPTAQSIWNLKDKESIFLRSNDFQFLSSYDSNSNKKQNKVSTAILTPKPSNIIETLLIVDQIKPEMVLDKKNCIYLFSYCNDDEYDNILANCYKYLISKDYCTVCMRQPCLEYLINYTKTAELHSSDTPSINLIIDKVEENWKFIMVPISLILFAIAINYSFKIIIFKLSMFDPAFSDFIISASKISKFKELTSMDSNHCAICFEEFISEDDVRSLECNHYFHPKCIDRWLIGGTSKKRCPCCRKDIEINERV